MRAAILGLAGVAAAGVFAAGSSSGTRYERVVNEPPNAVYNALAMAASSLKNERVENFKPMPTTPLKFGEENPLPGKTITFVTHNVAGESVSIEVLADGAEIADIDFTVKPAPDGKTTLVGTFDLDGAPLNMKPHFALLELASGKLMDQVVEGAEKGDLSELASVDSGTFQGLLDKAEAKERGIVEHDPSQSVDLRRREREEAMDAAAKPATESLGYNPSAGVGVKPDVSLSNRSR
jgi:hypothetical protein